MIYRELNVADYRQFLSLFIEEQQESPIFRERSFREDELRQAFYYYINHPREVFVRGVFDGDTLAGIHCSVITRLAPYEFTEVRDQITYIRKPYRGNGFILKRLLTMCQTWATERGVDRMVIDITGDIDSPFTKLLTKFGFEPTTHQQFQLKLGD